MSQFQSSRQLPMLQQPPRLALPCQCMDGRFIPFHFRRSVWVAVPPLCYRTNTAHSCHRYHWIHWHAPLSAEDADRKVRCTMHRSHFLPQHALDLCNTRISEGEVCKGKENRTCQSSLVNGQHPRVDLAALRQIQVHWVRNPSHENLHALGHVNVGFKMDIGQLQHASKDAQGFLRVHFCPS